MSVQSADAPTTTLRKRREVWDRAHSDLKTSFAGCKSTARVLTRPSCPAAAIATRSSSGRENIVIGDFIVEDARGQWQSSGSKGVTSGLGLDWPDHHLLIAITVAAFSRGSRNILGSKESNSASGDDYNYTRGDASTFKFISFAERRTWILPQPVPYNALFE
jgi:hypothetical protein